MKIKIFIIIFVSLFYSISVHADEVTYGRDVVVIKTTSGLIEFDMEMALDTDQRRQGLMFRKELSAKSGMLFDYGYPYTASMWMKNTLIPLDMLFVRYDGVIAYVHKRAIPGDLTAISANEPVRAVIEIAGGQAKAQGIKAGDKVLHSIFNTAP